MAHMKTLISRIKNPLLKPCINPNKFILNHLIPISFSKFFSTQLPNSQKNPSKPQKSTKDGNLQDKNKRPLDLVFKEGLCEKEQSLGIISEITGKNDELKKKLSSEGGNDVVVSKEISKDMEMMLRHLYDNGYFKDVNFLPGNKFDLNCFRENYAHDYVKRALQIFGNDKMEIAKWLSGSDVKSIALFGCPSTIKGDVYAAKKLRSFFKIKEETVCGECVLKESCQYADITRGLNKITTLRLDCLLRLLRSYSLEEISPRVKLSGDLKACVSRLIHDVINLTKGAAEGAADEGDKLASGRS